MAKFVNTRVFTLDVQSYLLTILSTSKSNVSPQAINAEIESIIMSRSKNCITYWKTLIPHMFNRRALGKHRTMGDEGEYFFKQRGFIPLGRSHSVNFKATSFSRANSGQLANALEITRIDIHGSTLYVTPCIARTDHRDYVQILVDGAQGGGDPYNPSYDARHPMFATQNNQSWGGIPKEYWSQMQYIFVQYLEEQEYAMNRDIEDLLINYKLIQVRGNVQESIKQEKSKIPIVPTDFTETEYTPFNPFSNTKQYHPNYYTPENVNKLDSKPKKSKKSKK